MEKNASKKVPSILTQLGLWCWLLLCGLIPINGHLVPVSLSISVLLSVILAIIHRPRIHPWMLWPLFLFYFLHVVGMAWSTDIAFGLFDLQVKLGLVALPLAAMVMSALIRDLLHKCMVAFTIGFVVAMALGFWEAWQCYAESGLSNCFSQSTLSYELHPSYSAWYGCWIIAYWSKRLIECDIASKELRAAIGVALPLVLLFVVMLASKSGVAGLALVVAFFFVYAMFRLNGRRRIASLAAVVLLSILVAVTQGRLVLERMQIAWHAAATYDDGPNEAVDPAEGSELRLMAWSCSVANLRAHPWGAGTGDIKHALMDCYVSNGDTEAAKRNLNSHCQFLQGGVALGWPGAISTVLLALVPLYLAWKRRSVHLGLFAVLFIVNAAVESVLEVQAGVVFFAIFTGLLLAWSAPRMIETNVIPQTS